MTENKITINSSAKSETDWAKWIETNRNSLVIVLALIVVGLFGGGYLLNQSNKSKEEYNAKIFNYQTTSLAEYNKNLDDAVLLSSFKSVYKTTGNYVGLIPALIKTADAFILHGKKDQALEVLLVGLNVSSNEYVRFFINTRLAVVYEDLGKNQEAIDVLTKITSNDLKVFEGKYYLDLGRIYQKMGKLDKAKASFSYVVDKAHDDIEFVKIAKLHLASF